MSLLHPSAVGREVELGDLAGTVDGGRLSSGELTTPIAGSCPYCQRSPCVKDLGDYSAYFKSLVKQLDQTEAYRRRYCIVNQATYPVFINKVWSENRIYLRSHLRPLRTHENLRHARKEKTPTIWPDGKFKDIHVRWDPTTPFYKAALAAVRTIMEIAADEHHFLPKEQVVPWMTGLLPDTSSPSTSHGAITITSASSSCALKPEVPVTALPENPLDEDQEEDSEYESGSDSEGAPIPSSIVEQSGYAGGTYRHAYPQPSEYVSSNMYQPSRAMPGSYMPMAPMQVNAYSPHQGSATLNTHHPTLTHLPNLIAGNLLDIAPRTESGHPVSQAFSTPPFPPGFATSVAEANTSQNGHHLAPNRILPRLDGMHAPSYHISSALATRQHNLKQSLTTSPAAFLPDQNIISPFAVPGQMGPFPPFARYHGAATEEPTVHGRPQNESSSHLRPTIYDSELNNPVTIHRGRVRTPFTTEDEALGLPTFPTAEYWALGHTTSSDLEQYGIGGYGDTHS